jgi:integrase
MGAIHRLSAKQIDRCGDGMHADGGNLYFRRTGNAASWIFRYTCRIHHRTFDLGLGKYPEVSLDKARKRAFDYRVKIADGVDVAAEHMRARREALAISAPVAKPTGYTFERCAHEFIASQEAGWGRESTGQWIASLQHYAFPVIGNMPVDRVDTDHVLRVLKPIWESKHVTATRVRNRIERILDWAKAKKLRDGGEYPARWKGHMQHLLAGNVNRVEHHEAVPVKEIPAFMRKLRACDGTTARALELLALTATRKAEVLYATFGEFDLEAKVWVIPASRTKTGKSSGEDHVVPLSDRAVAIVAAQRAATRDPDGFVFASRRTGGAIGRYLMGDVMKEICGEGPVPHGLRSTFRDWCGENGHPHEHAEMALAHAVGKKTTRAYFRSRLVEERRKIMEAWAEFCGG